MINGVASEIFTPQCGLRQGDPLSSYLFLFCMDVFSRMTSLGVEIRQFQASKYDEVDPLSHIYYLQTMLCSSFVHLRQLALILR